MNEQSEHIEERKLRQHEIRYIQGLLKLYPLMKKELAELESRIETLRGEISLPQFQQEKITAQGLVTDPTARRAFKALRLRAAWDHKVFFVNAIEDVLELLDPEKRKAIELKYFKKLQRYRVALELHVSEQTIFRWERDIWPLFADRLGI